MTALLPPGKTPVPFDWSLVDRIRRRWRGAFLVKGIDTRRVRLCLEHGVDGIMVSNHGGRATETLRATLDALPKWWRPWEGQSRSWWTAGSVAVYDVFKAIALGASAVGIGRPYLWGLGAFGKEGVDRVLEILDDELRLAMRSCGTASIKDITGSYVARA